MGIKPTRDQRDEAVEYTRELLIRALHFGQIKTALRSKFPWIVGARTCADYVSRARGVMLSDLNANRDQMRAQSVERYDAILRGKEVPDIVKVRAQERIDKLLGLESPQRTELSGPDGKPLQVVDATERLSESQLRRVVDLAEAVPIRQLNGEHTNGNGSSNGGGNGAAHAGSSPAD